MKHKKKHFIIGGLILGLIWGIWPIVNTYRQFPSFPGMFEFTVQLLMVSFFGVIGAVLGFFVSLIVTSFYPKNAFKTVTESVAQIVVDEWQSHIEAFFSLE